MKQLGFSLLTGLGLIAQIDTGTLRDPLIEPVTPGQNCVQGTSPVKEGTATLMRGGEKAGDDKKFDDGTFRICVSPAFGEGEKLYVKVTFKTGGAIKDSNKVDVGLSPTTTSTDALTPLSIGTLKGDDTAIKGSAPVKDGSVRVSINGVTVADPVTKKPLETKLSNGSFKIELPDGAKLKENQLVAVTMNIVSADNRLETLKASKDVSAGAKAAKVKINLLRFQADQTIIAGTITQDDGQPAFASWVKVQIFAKAGTGHEKNPYFESTADFGAKVCESNVKQYGVFCVSVDRSIGEGDLLKVSASARESKETHEAQSEIVEAQSAVAAPTAYYNVAIFDLAEGDSELRGTMPATAEKVVLSIFRGRGPGYGTNIQLARLEATTDKTKREFVAQNLARFSEGQSVVAVALDSAGTEVGRSHAASVRPLRYNWGRVRADFNVGAVLGRENKGFSSPQPFVRFFSDQNWKPFRTCRGYAPEDKNTDEALRFIIGNCPDLRRGDPTGDTGRRLIYKRQIEKMQMNTPSETDQAASSKDSTAGEPKKVPLREAEKNKRLREQVDEILRLRRRSHWLINTYQIVDLTQTPRVTAAPAAAPATPPAMMGTATAPLEFQITQSRNQLYFEGGVYTPFIPSMFQWTFQGLDNALYIAPIAKAGFMTVDNATGDSGQAGVYKFMAAGGRIGHMEIKNEPGNAPDSIFWVDTVFGRYDVYRQSEFPAAATLTQRDLDARLAERFHNRIDVSGYFKIPASPFFFTFGGNFPTNPRDRVKADARIVFGARIDITRLFGQMIPTLKR